MPVPALMVWMVFQILSEQSANIRQVTPERRFGRRLVLRIPENTAQDDGLTIVHQHLRLDFVGVDGRYSVEDVANAILLDVQLHDYPIIRGDLRRYLQRQDCILEGR